MSINLGMTEQKRETVAKALEVFLADTYALYLKTQNYHWNVEGVHFQPLHEEFEKQYHDLAEATDTIAEQIRALGFPAPGSFIAFQELTNVKEANDNKVIAAEKMVETLADDNELIVRSANHALEKANEAGDEGSADLLAERIRKHEKVAWMLRSMAA